jgi:hypothetical protein
MSDNDFTKYQDFGTTASHDKTKLIPALLTNSLRVVLHTFGESIYRLTARGSTTTTNRATVDSLSDYGVGIEQGNKHSVTIDYELLTDSDGKRLNPLTENAVSELLSEVETQLDSENLSVAPDLAVTSVTLRVTDERLAAVTPAQTNEFDLQFSADQVEDALADRTERVNAGRGLYSELGFNRTNLNLRSAIETVTKYSRQADGCYIRWGGPENVRPRTSPSLAARINTHVLPDEYGLLKPYTVVADNLLDIDEDELDESLTESARGSQSGDR